MTPLLLHSDVQFQVQEETVGDKERGGNDFVVFDEAEDELVVPWSGCSGAASMAY